VFFANLCRLSDKEMASTVCSSLALPLRASARRAGDAKPSAAARSGSFVPLSSVSPLLLVRSAPPSGLVLRRAAAALPARRRALALCAAAAEARLPAARAGAR